MATQESAGPSKWAANLNVLPLRKGWLVRAEGIAKALTHLSNSGDITRDDVYVLASSGRRAYTRKTPSHKRIHAGDVNKRRVPTFTEKRLAIMRGILEGSTNTDIATSTGSNVGYVSNVRTSLDGAVNEALHAYGLHPEGLIRRMATAIDTSVERAVTKDGRVVTTGPDWQTRTKLMELASKMGGYIRERREITGANGSAIVVRHTASLDSD